MNMQEVGLSVGGQFNRYSVVNLLQDTLQMTRSGYSFFLTQLGSPMMTRTHYHDYGTPLPRQMTNFIAQDGFGHIQAMYMYTPTSVRNIQYSQDWIPLSQDFYHLTLRTHYGISRQVKLPTSACFVHRMIFNLSQWQYTPQVSYQNSESPVTDSFSLGSYSDGGSFGSRLDCHQQDWQERPTEITRKSASCQSGYKFRR